MERIDVYRGADMTDADGNAVHGVLSLWESFDALVAPAMGEENVTETATMPVHVGFTIYIRSESEAGIRIGDVIDVRGQRLPVTSPPASWSDASGRHVGDVVDVAFAKGM